ncbi:MAG: 2-oxoglutarate dehydrogenase complex dihydrolipoyllysine-residue succinyltransferase [Flavobacteriales bacterium]|nr:2-oxoglutarate dehydrogenase complex dihydrolipoyllysine-residue succinyltransferase [Flavobacteriales bacterium]
MSVELKIPAIGESISEVTISQWLKKSGEYVEMDEVIAELESEKATVELNASHSGTIEIIAEEGSDVKIGSVVALIDTNAKAPEKPEEEQKVKSETTEEKKPQTDKHYASGTPSPSAAKILAEKNINPDEINGTGKDGRITRADAIAAKNENGNKVIDSKLSDSSARSQRREKMSNLRKAVSKRLVSAKNETAMLTTFNEVDLQKVMDIRNRYKEKFKSKHEVGLGFMSFFTRASVLSLQKFPSVNAYIDGSDILYNDFCDISIAVSGPKGLMVPVIRNAENMTLWDIEKEVGRLAQKARDNKLSIEEMTGGTFTISNGGVFGSMLSTPILNPPQSAILGMHNILQRPIAENGQVVIRPMMYLALSYDHRIIDGRESVGFLLSIKNYLENPETMLSGKDPVEELLGF